jgi:hypothetical protein
LKFGRTNTGTYEMLTFVFGEDPTPKHLRGFLNLKRAYNDQKQSMFLSLVITQ